MFYKYIHFVFCTSVIARDDLVDFIISCSPGHVISHQEKKYHSVQGQGVIPTVIFTEIGISTILTGRQKAA